MLPKPLDKNVRRAAILDKLFDGPQTVVELRKEFGQINKIIDGMLKAGTISRVVGGVEITDDGRTLVRIARKRAPKNAG